MARKLRTYCDPRDVSQLPAYLRSHPKIQLVGVGGLSSETAALTDAVHSQGIELYVQVAPQWQWGYLQDTNSTAVMKAGAKFLAAEGAMFRWLGKLELAGTDVGFYLSPWGIGGNAKSSVEKPQAITESILAARALQRAFPRWQPSFGRKKILVIGQMEKDRARYFRGESKTNGQLLANAQAIWGMDNVVYRPHPLDGGAPIGASHTIDANEPLQQQLMNFGAAASANSTSTIECLCVGIPTMCDGYGAWSAFEVVQRMSADVRVYEECYYEEALASLLALHYFPSLGLQDPLDTALNFYSPCPNDHFRFNSAGFVDQPEPWTGTYYWSEA